MERVFEYNEDVDYDQDLHQANEEPTVVELRLGLQIPIRCWQQTEQANSDHELIEQFYSSVHASFQRSRMAIVQKI